MADETAPHSSEASKDALDLNSLSGLDFGPDWADGKPSKSSPRQGGRDKGSHKAKGKRPSRSAERDRRTGGRPQRSHAERGGKNAERGRREFGRAAPGSDFVPTVDINLYPQDEAFEALVKRLKASARTYQLFEIAQLLLEKPERYVVLVSPKKKQTGEKDSQPLLYYSVPGHLPFETEEQAISFVVKEHIDLFFDVEEIEVDPPSGNFQMVNRCGVTGELLGPPNYHRYQEFVQRHYANRINGMPFERFQAKITPSKEQEDIDAWLESMKQGARYTVKDRQENEPESFETLEAARHFLIQHRKDKIVGSGESVRFAGRDIERLPKGNIRRSVEQYVEQQKHFPLDSANNIRGRLRRHKFAVYKKGSKGISYVCAVKRKFRDSKTVFTDSINDLIAFIEKHPEIPASKLSKEYIGIDTEKQKPATLEMKETPGEQADTAGETPKENEAEATEKADDASSEPDAPVIKEASTEATPKASLSPTEQEKLNQLMLDLRWLITEGYVTEYGDGRLFAAPPLPEPNKKAKQPAKENATKPTEAQKDSETKATDASDRKTVEAGDVGEANQAEEKPRAEEDSKGANEPPASASEPPRES
jgi:hypothetical protein